MPRPKSLAQKLKELEESRPRDFDPEDAGASASESEDSNSGDETIPNHAREHYEVVGKSKLREPEAINLGPQYVGSRVRRHAVEQEDEDDPFSREFGSDASSGDSEGDIQSSEEKLDNANGFAGSSEEESVEDDGTEPTDEDEEDDDRFGEPQSKQNGIIDRSELRNLMAQDQKSVAAILSQSARADAEKGKAVKAQRSTFDALLNSRIKLQKALVATNSLIALEGTSKESRNARNVVEAAETAAIALWNNLNSLRETLQSSKTGEKRTIREFQSDELLGSFWDEMQSYEKIQKRPRYAALDFWASKTRSTTTILNTRGRLQQPAKEQQLSDVLTGQLSDMDRLVSKTSVARSCAPVQAASAINKTQISNGTTNDNDQALENTAMSIYDDADFYTTLLANLISQRSTENTVSLSNLNIQPWQAAREAKTKKVVDTKASKGRKLRYTVHEKLVSFMAPEDRGSWGERQADELFGSLFGRRVELGEDVDVDEMEDNREVEGLRLFGGR